MIAVLAILVVDSKTADMADMCLSWSDVAVNYVVDFCFLKLVLALLLPTAEAVAKV